MAATDELSSGASPLSETESTRWEKTLAHVVNGIVVLRVLCSRTFDTESVGFSLATGFVVDKERGIICSNRHVVHVGPVRGEAVFHNHEEVNVLPIYRDPIHDFGFFRFDPKAVQFMDVVELPLNPTGARVGVQIRVAGNDAGEKLSILAGTLARLDRPAPRYGTGRYNDYNTFYYQAASSTSGGSSGSPVFNIDGQVVALNAGGKTSAASSYYFPLDRLCRALALVQQDIDNIRVPRGTLQTIFRYRPYDELRRLGLPRELEEHVRQEFPEGTGMLVVGHSVPESAASSFLQSGDVLAEVNGKLTTLFIPLESVLDDSVGQSIEVAVYRGGTEHRFNITVEDLEAITPSEFLEVSGAILHSLSFQQSVSYAVPTGSVYLAAAGYAFNQANIPKRSVIVSLANREVRNIDEFVEVYQTLPHRQRVAIKYYTLEKPDDPAFAMLQVDRKWYEIARVVRNDRTGLWDRTELGLSKALPPFQSPPQTVSFERLAAPRGFEGAMHVLHSLVMVQCQLPYSIEGVHGISFVGTGIVISKERGLVLTDRNTVPNSLADVSIQIASSLTVQANIVYIHPIHNFTVISYDPSVLADTDIRAIEISEQPLRQGDSTLFIGLSKPDFYSPTYQSVFLEVQVTKIQEQAIDPPSPPRYRAINCEFIHLDNDVACEGAVLTDLEGKVRGVWSSYSAQTGDNKNYQFSGAIPIHFLQPMIRDLQQGLDHPYRSLDVELWPISLAEARALNVSPDWLSQYERIEGEPRQILLVKRLVAGSPTSTLLRDGDLIIAINGEVVSTFWKVERLALTNPLLTVEIFRNGAHLTIEIPPVALSGVGTSRICHWSGCLIQETHRAVALQQRTPISGVYSSRWYYGSPAHKYSLRAAIFILEVNEQPVPNLDAFIDVVSQLADNVSVRIKTLSLNCQRPDVITLKTDYHYWPTSLFERIDGDWKQREIEIRTTGSEAASSSASPVE